MTIKQLAVEISKYEGKIEEVSIGNIREVIAILSDIIWEDFNTASYGQKVPTINVLLNNGKRRAKAKKK